jgi:hypothetical protein
VHSGSSGYVSLRFKFDESLFGATATAATP